MSSKASGTAVNGGGGSGELMLFGVRVVVNSIRKSVSMISQSCNKGDVVAAAAGYDSADDPVHNNSRASRERKRGVPWTAEEHELFLLGLQKLGKGDWRGISRNFVSSRTPTQVASHAQRYFLRRSNMSRRRRRSSLFSDDGEGNGNDGDDGDDGGGGGGGDKNKKRGGGSGDGEGEGEGEGGDKAEGGDGYENGMDMDCRGQLGFGYRCTYHAGYENGYPVGQLHPLRT
ncbi:hypothetical protein Ddye_004598 [Dipteronia dyeriana]|uniref:Uncharacterized protein n=1 Tax=Dipteronia dyeriana TaxID=168575 RepID=A0AAE0CWL7_9ROSI|nr:hypothetical protein Ddye_004598 [Dipteronia dyeriana]